MSLVFQKVRKRRRATTHKRRAWQVLDGLYHRPFIRIEDLFSLILRTWCPPPAKVLDPTAGPLRMYGGLLGNCQASLTEGVNPNYDFTFGDIEPQRDNVKQMDARALPFDNDLFDAVVMDPPYRRTLRGATREDVKDYRGDPDFNLEGFIAVTNVEAARVLKPKGKLIFKIGDGRPGGVFEPWHIWAVELFNRFSLEDIVILKPWYRRHAAFTRKDRSTQTHSYFMLFEKIDHGIVI